jgi:hypothetical protein
MWELEVVASAPKTTRCWRMRSSTCTASGMLVCGVENGQIWKGIKSTVMSRAKEVLKGGFNFEELNTLTDKKVRAAPSAWSDAAWAAAL